MVPILEIICFTDFVVLNLVLLLLAFIFALFGQLENISMQTFGRRLVGQTAGATENKRRWCKGGGTGWAFRGGGGWWVQGGCCRCPA